MALTFKAYARNNGAFRAARSMPSGSPEGIIIHSTGVNNPNLRRYVNAPEVCGENPYKNYFDRGDSDVCPHAVIGLDNSGEVRAAKLLPWNICCWGCGSGSSGSYNYSPAYVQIEVCEDELNDREYFDRAFGLAAELCQRLLRNYPTIRPEDIISHHEAHLRGYASNHADCDHWLGKFGLNMDWFRALVSGEKQVKITAEVTVAESRVDGITRQLQALGCSVTTEK